MPRIGGGGLAMFCRILIFLVIVAALTPVVSLAQTELRSAQPPHQSSFIAIPRPIPPPPPPGDGWVWVPPTYRWVWARVWREPVYQTVTESVWVPDEYGWRTTCYWDGQQYVQRQEWVLITPAHYETRTRRAMVSPGGMDVGAPLRIGQWRSLGMARPQPTAADASSAASVAAASDAVYTRAAPAGARAVLAAVGMAGRQEVKFNAGLQEHASGWPVRSGACFFIFPRCRTERLALGSAARA
jgi:hypothetical protein